MGFDKRVKEELEGIPLNALLEELVACFLDAEVHILVIVSFGIRHI